MYYRLTAADHMHIIINLLCKTSMMAEATTYDEETA